MNTRWLVWIVTACVSATAPALAEEPSFPRGAVQLPSGPAQVEFHAAGDVAILTVRAPDGSAIPLRPISDVKDALAVLGDSRLSFAWPALLEWAGKDLVPLRDKSLARNRLAAEVGMMGAPPAGAERWTGDAALSATLHYARSLVASGQRSAAIALLNDRLAKLPHDAPSSFPRVFLTNRLATVLFNGGQTSQAISLLEAALDDKTIQAGAALNLSVNLALALARTGQYRRALILIDEAWKRPDVDGIAEPETYRVPSSEATFAFIKACALGGLGQRDKALALISDIAETPSSPMANSDESNARLQAFICMHDAKGLSQEIARQLDTALPAADLFVDVQPDTTAYEPEARILAAAMARPEVQRAAKAHLKLLAPDFTPALSKWAVR